MTTQAQHLCFYITYFIWSDTTYFCLLNLSINCENGRLKIKIIYLKNTPFQWSFEVVSQWSVRSFHVREVYCSNPATLVDPKNKVGHKNVVKRILLKRFNVFVWKQFLFFIEVSQSVRPTACPSSLTWHGRQNLVRTQKTRNFNIFKINKHNSNVMSSHQSSCLIS